MMPGSKLKGVSRKIEDAGERQRLKKIVAALPIPEDTGVIVRTAGAGTRKRNFVLDLTGLVSTWEEMQRAISEDPTPCCVYQELDLVERVVRDWLTEDVDRIVVDSREKFERIRAVAGRISRRARSRIHLYEGELPIFDHYDVERQAEEAFRRKVQLKSGGYIVFDETEALIAVDVNTGRHKGSGSQEEAILAVNTEAVEEIARQLRLRNIGGLVVMDLIDMRTKRHQHAVFRALKAALRRDGARTNVSPISELGLLEMTRQRAEESFMSSFYMECPYCKAKGNVKSPLAMSVEIQRQVAALLRKQKKDEAQHGLQVIVHPTVLERLRTEDEAFLVQLESRYGRRLGFRSDASKHLEFFSISDTETGQVLYQTAPR
jgi:ribonuclease G